MSKAHRPAGGIQSKNVTQRPVKTGQPAHRKRHEAVAQIGSVLGNHVTSHSRSIWGAKEVIEGGLIPGVGSQRLGNEVAKSTVCGPGGSRTVYAQGTQQSGAVRSMGSTRDTLAEFGPDSPNVAARK